jgi:hypothetical protein
MAVLAAASAFGQCNSIPNTGFNRFTGGSLGTGSFWSAGSGWNADISGRPVDPSSALWISTIRGGGAPNLGTQYSTSQWASWGEPWYGIFYHVVDGSKQPRVEVKYTAPEAYPESSDPGPFPIPFDPRIQGMFKGMPGTPEETKSWNFEGDKHIIVIDKKDCLLYELWNVYSANGKIHAGTGSVYDLLGGDRQRPYLFTGGASVSGLPLFAGTVRYDEIQAGEIKHPIAMTFLYQYGRGAFTGMATHHQYNVSGTDVTRPPFGAIARLKSTFDISGFSPAARTVLTALKKYGAIYVDGGRPGDMFFTTDDRWSTADMFQLSQIPLSSDNFEFIQTGPIYGDPFKGAPAPPTGPAPTIATFAATRTRIRAGEPVTLSWNVSGVPTRLRFITPNVGPVVTDFVVVKPTRTTTYTLMVQNENGRTTSTVTINVDGSSGGTTQQLYVGVGVSSIPNAAALRLTITKPDNSTETRECAASPCDVMMDPALTGQSLLLQYLSGTSQPLATSENITVKFP